MRQGKIINCFAGNSLRSRSRGNPRTGEMIMRHNKAAKGFMVTAFGVGLFLAYCFPSKFIIISLSVLLVLAGVFIIKA